MKPTNYAGKIIIFEGTDHCGKTTIAQEFCKAHPEYQYFKIKQEHLDIKETDPNVLAHAHLLQLNFFLELAKQVDFRIVMDRFYPSEIVYGSLFREVNVKELLKFDRIFAALNTHIVLVEKSDDELEDALWTREQLIAIKDSYRLFFTDTKCKTICLNTDSEDLQWELNEIDKFISSNLDKIYVKKPTAE